jgi:DNA-binding NtrC family response regulator
VRSNRVHQRQILIIDDDRELCLSLVDALCDAKTEVAHVQRGSEGVELCRQSVVDVVLLDQQLPDAEGVNLCPHILDANDSTKIVFMTAYPTFDNAVAALKMGASDYISKPFELEEVRLAVARAFRLQELERIEVVHRRRREHDLEGATLVGEDGGLAAVATLADLAAGSDAPVLITGETGTGKSLLARRIHYASRRSDMALVELNCAALPETLAESELFGHERGAFTGAAGAHRGVFEMADGGTVLLDEIGAMALPLQAKLLGVLDHLRVRRLGSERMRQVDVRVIAATNSDLETAVAQHVFRTDLYFRLGVIRIHLPPLRDHLSDLPELCRHVVRDICGWDVELADGEFERLARYSWPGNVRELRSVLERSLIIHRGQTPAPSRLLPGAGGSSGRPTPVKEPSQISPLADVERDHIARVLVELGGNLTRSAQALGIALSTLKRKIERYQLEGPRRS